MPAYRSKTNTAGRHVAVARSLWRATGIKNAALKKPIIALDDGSDMDYQGMLMADDKGAVRNFSHL